MTATSTGWATLAYKVRDNLVPHVAVTIRLFGSKGKLARIFTVGRAWTGRTLHRLHFVCNLAVGVYTVRAWDTDLAGNHQVKVATNTLTVK
jgi:hypothetical protein